MKHMTDFEKALLKDYMNKNEGYRLSQFRRSPLITSYTPEFNSIINSFILSCCSNI
jgi:hypothetical protein